MLKRYQVLLNDWMVDFIKKRAESFDISFSECLRLALCLYYGNVIKLDHPECEFPFSIEDVMAKIKTDQKIKASLEEQHKAISQLYFEARKAVELAAEAEKDK